MERFIPCGKLLLVEIIDTTEKKSAHGIIITTNNDSQVCRGTVISQGDYDEANPFAEGDVVIFARYAGVELAEGVKVMKPEDILAKVVKDA